MIQELRKLPSVHQLLEHERLKSYAESVPRAWITDAARNLLAHTRDRILSAQETAPTQDALISQLRDQLDQKLSSQYQQVINATGVVIHTNLGRTPLPSSVVERLASANGYVNLEYDLHSGQRGQRYGLIPDLLTALTSCEASIVVNNNAAAVLLVLSALCRGRNVLISRGELVEIGGGFRIPEVLEQSGCILREVGTTNKTYAADYESAVDGQTAAVLKVHTSNYRIEGFTQSPSRQELKSLCQRRGLLFLEDLGSGALIRPLEELGFREPLVQEVVPWVDVVTFSGDKMLGGPQAGLILGRRELLDTVRKHPLLRAVRLDKLSLLALEAVLWTAASGRWEELPLWDMLSVSSETLYQRASEWLACVGPPLDAHIIQGHSAVGGGALPGENPPTWLLALTSGTSTPEQLHRFMRAQKPPIVARVSDNQLLLDPRTVHQAQSAAVAAALRRCSTCMS